MVLVEVFVGLKGPRSIRLNHKVVGGHSGDTIIWNFHSVSAAAEEVEIDFVSNDYFPGRRPGSPLPKLRVPLNGGYARLVGTIPSLGGPAAPGSPPAPSTDMHKYTVRVYDRGGSMIGEEDPYVVPSDP